MLSLFLSFNAFVFAQEPDTPLSKDEAVVQETVQGPEEANVEADASGDDAAKGKNSSIPFVLPVINLTGNLLGLPLRGVTERRDTEWLHSWIT